MATPRVYLVDDDDAVRDALGLLLSSAGFAQQSFASAQAFLDQCSERSRGCVLLDIRMPEMDGLTLQRHLKARNITLPIVFITGHGDVPMAVEAMRRGALDFFRKPLAEEPLLNRLREALQLDKQQHRAECQQQALEARLETLSPREHQVFWQVAEGLSNRDISAQLGLTERTVEVYRYKMMKKLKANTLADLVRLKLQFETYQHRRSVE